MGNGLKSVSRLTFFFIIAFIISGGVLTYFSISSISNLEELTEKKVLEEKNQLYRRIMDSLETTIERLTTKFKFQTKSYGFNQDSLTAIKEYSPYYSFPFHYLDHGDFSYPYYINNLKVSFDENLTRPYCNSFNLGEIAEFPQKQLLNAKIHYQKCLSISENSADSARALNALARISVKSANMSDAIEYSGRIILYYPEITDPSGYPYSYYSISQLTNIKDPTQKDKQLSYLTLWLNNIYQNKVPLMHSSEVLIDDISNWLHEFGFIDQEKLSQPIMHIQDIKKRLKQIGQYGNLISENMQANDPDRNLYSINGFQIIENYNDDQGYLLVLNKELGIYIGFVIDIDMLLNSVITKQSFNDLEFNYKTEVVNFSRSESLDHKNQLYQLNPYITRFAVRIELSNSALISNYVNIRRWIYGIALTVLLSGMLFAITLILRDINREKQIAILKSDFISNVTHELKSPITSIKMFAESMLLGRVKNQDGNKEYLEVIMRESERLKRMINNILDFSRMEEQQLKYRLENRNLSTLINEVIEEMNYWFVEKKIKLITEIDGNINSNIDNEKIKQVLSNLISNAIKYTPESNNIYLRLFKNGEHNLIEVEDQGIGIPEDQVGRIFEKFYRVSGEDTEGVSGTGLGLTVVKEIIDAHRWEISVESKLGQGSKFIILF